MTTQHDSYEDLTECGLSEELEQQLIHTQRECTFMWTNSKGEAFGVIESVKAVSDLNAPVAGEVVAINEDLLDQPEIINEECYGTGWIIKIKPSDRDELDSLLDADGYRKLVSKRSA